ncbi:hypothetical protein [Mesorhizobium sp.]|uniref:hypothetical protein n=1 Tax=Mesorhizobium sp. TaxID=1871066 RepID=UPI0025F233E6|nr:hypothetical protein [Mesorhizobium sp.]
MAAPTVGPFGPLSATWLLIPVMLLKMVAPTERMFVAKVPKSQTRRSLWLQAGGNAMRNQRPLGGFPAKRKSEAFCVCKNYLSR